MFSRRVGSIQDNFILRLRANNYASGFCCLEMGYSSIYEGFVSCLLLIWSWVKDFEQLFDAFVNILSLMRLSRFTIFLLLEMPKLTNELTSTLPKYSYCVLFLLSSQAFTMASSSLFFLINAFTLESICSFSDKHSSRRLCKCQISFSFLSALSNILRASSLNTINCFSMIYIFCKLMASLCRACWVSSLNSSIYIRTAYRWFLYANRSSAQLCQTILCTFASSSSIYPLSSA